MSCVFFYRAAVGPQPKSFNAEPGHIASSSASGTLRNVRRIRLTGPSFVCPHGGTVSSTDRSFVCIDIAQFLLVSNNGPSSSLHVQRGPFVHKARVI